MSRMQFDPRTVARDIPGVFNTVFPQLTPGVVAHYNREAAFLEVQPVDSNVLAQSKLQVAMLAEIASALVEAEYSGRAGGLTGAINVAVARQRRYYDARIPADFTEADVAAVDGFAGNLRAMMGQMNAQLHGELCFAPSIPGYQWISTGSGDASLGSVLVEVKFTSRNFSSADYRQVVIYWMLKYLSALESNETSWDEFVLLNPRRGSGVRVRFDRFLNLIGGGRTTVELAQAFQAIVATRE